MRALLAGLVAGLLAVAAIAAAPPPASALTCVVPVPARMLAQADAAFVGRLVNATADRWVFAVDEPVKGDLGAEVQIRRSGPAVVSGWFTPQPGVQIGLVVHRDADGVLTANDCGRLTPVQLRAAAAAPDISCKRPRISSLRFRQPGRVDVEIADLDDPRTVVRVDWGDGRVSWQAARGGGPRRTVTLRHRYRAAGRRSLRVQVIGHPAAACGGPHLERTALRPVVVQT